MKLFLVFLPVLLLATPPVSAKCAPEFFVFSGMVTDKTGAPLAGASVGISWADGDGASGSAIAVTDPKGSFSISVAFDTYSGKGTADEDLCNHRVRSVSFSARKGQFRSPYQRAAIGPSRNVALPTSVVWLEPDKKPAVRLLGPLPNNSSRPKPRHDSP